ncbi:MAG: helix-turn-helix domain-containing protein [Legionellaceae bacterium]|nr:helix-turn-helix domain-containing protein [Legionellaceae bacterium]
MTIGFVAEEVVSAEIIETPGAQLVRERENQGLSQEYVAEKLHLRVQTITLLESDNFESLPEVVFIKGYLRAYAKLLGISPDPLMAGFDRFASPEKKMERASWLVRREMPQPERRWRFASTGILLLLCGLAWFVWKQNQNTTMDTEKPPVLQQAEASVDMGLDSSRMSMAPTESVIPSLGATTVAVADQEL